MCNRCIFNSKKHRLNFYSHGQGAPDSIMPTNAKGNKIKGNYKHVQKRSSMKVSYYYLAAGQLLEGKNETLTY